MGLAGRLDQLGKGAVLGHQLGRRPELGDLTGVEDENVIAIDDCVYAVGNRQYRAICERPADGLLNNHVGRRVD